MSEDIEGAAICRFGSCIPSRCGDGYVNSRMGADEQCDDGNAIDGDGCDTDCTFSCESAGDCDDGNICNGPEGCDPMTNRCRSRRMPAEDGTACGEERACRSRMCVAVSCGDSVVDMGEDCDDGNTTDGDGCDTDCTFSCTRDRGVEMAPMQWCGVCDAATNRCVSTDPPTCATRSRA